MSKYERVEQAPMGHGGCGRIYRVRQRQDRKVGLNLDMRQHTQDENLLTLHRSSHKRLSSLGL